VLAATVVAALFALAVVSMLLMARAYRLTGRSESLAKAHAEGNRRREAFDKETSRPISRGRDLISRLRGRVGR
tara:strand:+ start:3137 stop:3355 length:219 start_codon:yes stop_codon:yes gene_type:complete